MKTTLNRIRKYSPCADGYKKLLKFLGKTRADNKPLDLSVIFESNGIIDTVWCFRAVSGYEKELRLFAVFCARQVQHLMTDPRSIAAIDVSERYANGNATDEELTAAHDAANDARADAYADADDADADAYDAYYAADSDSDAAARVAAAAYVAARAANAAYYSAYAADSADSARAAAFYAARVADPEIQSIVESYLKELLSEK